MSWQNHARDAGIRALDELAKRVGDSGERVVHRLARSWRSMDDDEKREVMEVVVAVGGAAALAISAMREEGSKKKKAKTLVKKAGRKVLKKVARK